jgi:membrane protease YdiL (CAAX protease family)
MVVPCCMIHFHKPMLEALGAIVAGVFLGFLALRDRSWYGGALLHSLVAVSMDLLAVSRAGLFK